MLHPVARTTDFKDLEPIYVEVGGLNVGVYRLNGRYYAYIDVCPHEGGPACGGGVFGNVECEFKEGIRRDFVSREHYSIACPWHGIEFDLETGVCLPRKDWRLASLETLVEGDRVMVKR